MFTIECIDPPQEPREVLYLKKTSRTVTQVQNGGGLGKEESLFSQVVLEVLKGKTILGTIETVTNQKSPLGGGALEEGGGGHWDTKRYSDVSVIEYRPLLGN